MRQIRRRTAETLFPGYVFAHFDYAADARHVLSTSGVSGIVSFDGKAPPVADDVIEFLRAQIGVAESASAPVLGEGAWVGIVTGCFRDVEGRVLSADWKTERVRVLLSLLGREVQISVFAHQLVATGERPACFPVGLMTSQSVGAPVAR